MSSIHFPKQQNTLRSDRNCALYLTLPDYSKAFNVLFLNCPQSADSGNISVALLDSGTSACSSSFVPLDSVHHMLISVHMLKPRISCSVNSSVRFKFEQRREIKLTFLMLRHLPVDSNSYCPLSQLFPSKLS